MARIIAFCVYKFEAKPALKDKCGSVGSADNFARIVIFDVYVGKQRLSGVLVGVFKQTKDV